MSPCCPPRPVALAFGGLLPLGGRIADLVGRKRAFVIGLAGFAAASALGGAAAGPRLTVRPSKEPS